MSSNRQLWRISTPHGDTLVAETIWTVSRGRDTYGYNICTLRINGRRVASCNGGGYDMIGTVFGDWFAHYEPARAALPALTPHSTYLVDARGTIAPERYFNPHHAYFRWVGSSDDAHRVIASAETAGWYGLIHYVSAADATITYAEDGTTISGIAGTVVRAGIDGACGISSVRDIMAACGYELAEVCR